MSYSLAGAKEYITFDAFAITMIQKVLNFSIPYTGVKIGNLIPDTVERMAVPVIVNELKKYVAKEADLQPGALNTDSLGLLFAEQICQIAYENGVVFTTDMTDDMYKKDGIIWAALVGFPNAPGILARELSNAMEDVMEEQLGVPPQTVEEDDMFGTTTTESGFSNLTTMYAVSQSPGFTASEQVGPMQASALITVAPPKKKLPIPLLVGAGLAAFLLLS